MTSPAGELARLAASYGVAIPKVAQGSGRPGTTIQVDGPPDEPLLVFFQEHRQGKGTLLYTIDVQGLMQDNAGFEAQVVERVAEVITSGICQPEEMGATVIWSAYSGQEKVLFCQLLEWALAHLVGPPPEWMDDGDAQYMRSTILGVGEYLALQDEHAGSRPAR